MGVVISITGPVIKARNIVNPRIHDLVLISDKGIYGEILKIDGDESTIQVYESTNGLRIGDSVKSTGKPLTIELGPGLMDNIFNGLQESLQGDESFIKNHKVKIRLNHDKKWFFKPVVKSGDKLSNGSIIGEVNNNGFIHRILLPPAISGVIEDINEGEFTLDEPVGLIKTSNGVKKLYLYHEWPVKTPRPIMSTKLSYEPLITGQRVIDTLFPVALGGTVALPGPFGAGKTVLHHSFIKWAKVDFKVFIACGERGNETADLLKTIMNDNIKGVFFVNTSNMPILARESGIYSAVTVAEYFRDMGYNVLLMADSLSRWAEALREVSATMNELPAEEGFPSYLPSRIAQFFERAGGVKTLSDTDSSLTIIGSISPPSSDFSEPVTQYSTSITGASWFLDSDLAYKRHFPSISWDLSFSKYSFIISKWWSSKSSSWSGNVFILKQLLEEETELESLVKAIGFVALSRAQQVKLTVARIIHEGFLKQNAFDKVDYFCEPEKQILILDLIINFYNACLKSSVDINELVSNPLINELMNLKLLTLEELKVKYKEIIKEVGLIEHRVLDSS